MLPACNADHYLIEVPFVSGCRKPPSDLVGKALTEFQRPLTHGLVTDQDAAGCQHLLDQAQAERKPKVQPDSMADHLSRKTVTGIAGMTGLLHPSDIPHPGHPPVNLTVPPEWCGRRGSA
jgi:hypothetical protein